MNTIIFETEAEAARRAAEAALGVLRENPAAVFCLAAGHSSIPFFDALAAERADFSAARFIELDEWMDLPLTAPGSCAGFLRKHFFSRINIKEENIHFFDPLAADGDAECRRAAARIGEWGGIDFMLLGMGLNGHLALNEPGCGLDCPAHVAVLSKTTLEVAPKYFDGNMPPITRGITLGLSEIKAARMIKLLVLGSRKREIYARLRSAVKPDPSLPASALLELDHAELIADSLSAGG